MKLTYFKELNGVRGLAALMVMYFHFFSEIHPNGRTIEKILVKTAVFGQTGVILFFVLSGFLITRILLSAKAYSNYFSNFYVRRSLRIFPLYYLALAIYIITAAALNSGSQVTSATTWYYWPYLQNIAMTFRGNISGPLHFWSLAVEEHFYLFWPLVIYYTSVKRLPFVIGFIAICTIAIRLVLLYKGYEVFYFTGTTMDGLAIGAMLAVKEKGGTLSKKSIAFYLYSLSLSVPVIVVAWLFSGGKGLLLIQAFKGTLIAFTYYLALLLILNATEDNGVIKLLNQRVLQYTGKISYGLYVYHILCFSIYLKYLKTSHLLVDFFSCFVLSYAVASLSYYLFEVRFLSLKDKLTRKPMHVEAGLSLQPAG